MDINRSRDAIREIEQRASEHYWEFVSKGHTDSDDLVVGSIEAILWRFRHLIRALSELVSVMDRANDVKRRMHAIDYVGCNYRVISQFSDVEPYKAFLAILNDSTEQGEVHDRVRWWLKKITPQSGESADDTSPC